MTGATITYDRRAGHYEVAGAGGAVLGTFKTYREAADFVADGAK